MSEINPAIYNTDVSTYRVKKGASCRSNELTCSTGAGHSVFDLDGDETLVHLSSLTFKSKKSHM